MLFIDVGGSQYVIDGKIKLKSKSAMEGFTEKGLKFADGSELEADLVVFCTGRGCKPFSFLDHEH
jgi:NAD(P)H-nitrite reductase large subunit